MAVASLSQPEGLIRLHRGGLASAGPEGCVAMEMGATFVMSCLFPNGHLHAVEKSDSPCLRISVVQTVAYVRVLLAPLFSPRMTFMQCVCVCSHDGPGSVVVAVCFSFLRSQSQCVPPTQHWLASPGC